MLIYVPIVYGVLPEINVFAFVFDSAMRTQSFYNFAVPRSQFLCQIQVIVLFLDNLTSFDKMHRNNQLQKVRVTLYIFDRIVTFYAMLISPKLSGQT